jgi:porphobilinogen synthase
MNFPKSRLSRLRKNKEIRALIQENNVGVNDLITPIFVTDGLNKKIEIKSMPNYFCFSIDLLLKEIFECTSLGLNCFLLFAKIPESLKDNSGLEACNPKGLMQRSIKKIKSVFPNIILMSDVALDPYSIFGQDGIVKDNQIDNDVTINILSEMALSHVDSGVDFVAPSDMMDGRVKSIRTILEKNKYFKTGIMSYSAKYASSFYGPFRDALESSPTSNMDKRSYQINPSNSKIAMLEAKQDILEGADILMVKPGMPYLDILNMISKKYNVPVAVYQVSGEYSMIYSAHIKGWLNLDDAIIESCIAFKRAGATLISTYFSKKIAQLISEKKFYL